MGPTNEKLYSPSQWCNRRCDPKNVIDEHIRITEDESQKVRSKYPFKDNLKYGFGHRQLLDVFEPVESSSVDKTPTFVYIHGGYWQALNKEISCYCVTPLTEAGIRVVIPDYDLAPDVSLKVIVQEIEELIQYLGEKSSSENWGSLWIGGHSAGAHLAASMLYSEVRKYITGLVLISGIYDLRPLITTSVNTVLNLNENEAENLSPMLQIPKQAIGVFSGSIIMAVGEYDSPAFQEQQTNFSTVLKKIGIQIELKLIPNMDHFTIVEQLNNNAYILTKMIKNAILLEILQ